MTDTQEIAHLRAALAWYQADPGVVLSASRMEVTEATHPAAMTAVLAHIDAQAAEIERLRADAEIGVKVSAIAKAFIDSNRISCPEATTNDGVYENAPELVEKLCDVVGYYQYPEDDAAMKEQP